jgi:bifunctional non-homologous end joining protein LigD
MPKKVMPSDLPPMLAKPGSLPKNQQDYGFEIKWDGIRAIAYITDQRIILQSRNRKDITNQYPEISAIGKVLGGKQVVLDGEIVALGPDGKPSFSALQHRMGLRSEKTIKRMTEVTPVKYMIFDILFIAGASTEELVYTERRTQLEALNLDGTAWQTPPYYPGDGQALLKTSKQLDLEGVIAKRLNSIYEAGKRTGAWIKIKNQRRQELVIAGWVSGAGRRSSRIGAILTGYYDVTAEEAAERGQPQRLIYSGKVGTGFSDASLAELAAAFQSLRRPDNPFANRIPYKDAHFVEPRLIGEFEFTEWTGHNTLRHPSFKGLRTDKEPTEVIRE